MSVHSSSGDSPDRDPTSSSPSKPESDSPTNTSPGEQAAQAEQAPSEPVQADLTTDLAADSAAGEATPVQAAATERPGEVAPARASTEGTHPTETSGPSVADAPLAALPDNGRDDDAPPPTPEFPSTTSGNQDNAWADAALAAAAAQPGEPEGPPLPESFDELALPDTLRRAIVRLGWTKPSPVQALAFEPLIQGRDVMVQSHTGSGKTGAFCMPWLASRFVNEPASETGVQLLVLLPTRELAKQVCDELRRLAQETPVEVLPVYGGTPMNPQLTALRAGVHAVVGTPGRILDHIRRRSLDLSRVRTVVLDECDEMLSMGFLEDIRAILDEVKGEHLTALFSATIPSDIERIAKRYMHNPASVQLSGDQVAAAEIEHAFYSVTSSIKTRDLLDVIMVEDPARAIVFCNTREETKLVASVLRREGFHAEELSSDLNQTQRERVMKLMREHKLRFLVATDVAARGIDISHVSHVINYSFPESAEVYVHRTGRTGRAGRTGIALSLINPREIGNFYYLKLQYSSIVFTERHLPPAAQLAAQRTEFKLDGISKRFPELVSPEWVLLARSLMGDPRGERVIALLLERAMRQAPRPESVNEGVEASEGEDTSQHTAPTGPGDTIEREQRDLREGRERPEPREGGFGGRDRDRGRGPRRDDRGGPRNDDRGGPPRFGDRDRPRRDDGAPGERNFRDRDGAGERNVGDREATGERNVRDRDATGERNVRDREATGERNVRDRGDRNFRDRSATSESLAVPGEQPVTDTTGELPVVAAVREPATELTPPRGDLSGVRGFRDRKDRGETGERGPRSERDGETARERPADEERGFRAERDRPPGQPRPEGVIAERPDVPRERPADEERGFRAERDRPRERGPEGDRNGRGRDRFRDRDGRRRDGRDDNRGPQPQQSQAQPQAQPQQSQQPQQSSESRPDPRGEHHGDRRRRRDRGAPDANQLPLQATGEPKVAPAWIDPPTPVLAEAAPAPESVLATAAAPALAPAITAIADLSPRHVSLARRGRLGDRGTGVVRLPAAGDTVTAPLSGATHNADGQPVSGDSQLDESGDPRRKRRRRRRRGRRGEGEAGEANLADGARSDDGDDGESDDDQGANGEPTRSAAPSAANRSATNPGAASVASPGATSTPEQDGESGDARRKRRRRRRGGPRAPEAAASGAAPSHLAPPFVSSPPRVEAPPKPVGTPVAVPRRMAQDEIIIDIDEGELEVVQNEFGQMDDEFDEFALMDRRQAVIETLQEEVELEDLSSSDARRTAVLEDPLEGDDGDDEDDSEDEPEATEAAVTDLAATPASEPTADSEDADSEEDKKRKRRRRRKKAAPVVLPELTAPPHKDFWEVWAGKFTYQDFEDGKYTPPNNVPEIEDEPPAPVSADRSAPRQNGPRSGAPRGPRSAAPGAQREPRDFAAGPARTPPPPRSQATRAPLVSAGAELDDSEFTKVCLNLGRSHGHKAATIRSLLRDHLGLEGRAIRDLTVRDADTLFRVHLDEVTRIQEALAEVREGATQLAIEPASDDRADALRAPPPPEQAASEQASHSDERTDTRSNTRRDTRNDEHNETRRDEHSEHNDTRRDEPSEAHGDERRDTTPSATETPVSDPGDAQTITLDPLEFANAPRVGDLGDPGQTGERVEAGDRTGDEPGNN